MKCDSFKFTFIYCFTALRFVTNTVGMENILVTVRNDLLFPLWFILYYLSWTWHWPRWYKLCATHWKTTVCVNHARTHFVCEDYKRHCTYINIGRVTQARAIYFKRIQSTYIQIALRLNCVIIDKTVYLR